MNITKKYDRFKQWTDERMGASKGRTEQSDQFKDLEIEMGLRYEGMQTNQKAMNGYVKNMTQRFEVADKEKMTAVTYLGTSMANHGDDFSNDSDFGQCLTMMGRTHENIARAQETYTAKATSSWLESTERSLAQMKEYQAARKKMESRRLAYDTATSKMDRSKKEDFRLEEEARVQKTKYEESHEDVYRRMLDIREQEAESVQDLTDFLDAQLEYYERCHGLLTRLKQEWPSGSAPSRSNPAASSGYGQRYTVEQPPPLPAERPTMRSHRVASNSQPQSRADSTERPHISRAKTFEGPQQLRRDHSPMPGDALTRIPTNPQSIREQKYALRQVAGNRGLDSDAGYDSSTDPYSSSPSRFGENISPATSIASGVRQASAGSIRQKAPPPPPPSRAKKPPPPPPPKRGATNS